MIQLTNTTNSYIHFGSTNKETQGQNHLTFFDREHNILDRSYKLINQIGSKENPVRCQFYACSDGSEPLSFILRNKPSDKMTVEAYDISAEIIEDAQKGLFNLAKDNSDKKFYEKYKKFFLPVNKNTPKEVIEYGYGDQKDIYSTKLTLKQSTRNKLSFNVGNITTAFKKKQDEVSAVFFKNAWYLLPDDNSRIELAKDLFKNLKSKSLVIIGLTDTWKRSNDLEYNIDKLLTDTGFKPIEKVKKPPRTIKERLINLFKQKRHTVIFQKP